MNLKFITSFVILALMIALQLLALDDLGWSVDLVLVALITLTAFVNLHELLVLTFFSMWLMNWQSFVGPEILALGLIPLFAFVARKSSPWNMWASTAALSFIGVALFYLTAGVPVRMMTTQPFVLNAAAGSLFSLLLLWILYGAVGYRQERRLFAR